MWINPRTDKGWTDEEEQVFSEIMGVSRLNRIQAIQLWKRVHKDGKKAVRLAANCPKPSAARLARVANARQKSLDKRQMPFNTPTFQAEIG